MAAKSRSGSPASFTSLARLAMTSRTRSKAAGAPLAGCASTGKAANRAMMAAMPNSKRFMVPFLAAPSLHDGPAVHPGFVVAGDQAGELEGAGLAEAPDDLACA